MEPMRTDEMHAKLIPLLAGMLLALPTLVSGKDYESIETIIGDQKVVKTFHENGKMRSEERQKKNEKGKWVPDGIVKTYYPSGAKRGLLKFKMGVPVDTWKTFFENGKQYDERVYDKGTPTGTWKRFYDSGKPMEETVFKKISETVTEVHQKTFFKNGKVNEQGKWKRTAIPGKKPTNFKDGKWLYYDEKGKLTKTEHYSEGKIKKKDE